jgi:hypothetical protein
MKITGVVLVCGLIWLTCGVCTAQDDIKQLADPAFGKLTRPPAAFAHDVHNAKAAIKDCNVCHHVYSDGRFISEDNSAGRKCSECHLPGGAGAAVSLLKAYHIQCKDCHEAESKGPFACGGCHKRK